jgi:hypothetical protein
MEGINNIVEDTIVIKAVKKQVRLSTSHCRRLPQAY